MGLEQKTSSFRKVYSIEELVPLIDEAERNTRDLGLAYYCALVTGCFDILHRSQIEFLKQAKKINLLVEEDGQEHIIDSGIDTLVVGVDRDETVRLKGDGRPVNDLETRCENLADLECVDLVFPIPFALKSYTASNENVRMFEELTQRIRPSVLVTNELTDQFWKEKKARAKKLGITYVGLKVKRSSSSTEIARKIQEL